MPRDETIHTLATADAEPMRLGVLIDALKASCELPVAPFVSGGPPTRSVYFDWCQRTPCGLHSYRGIYSDLALGIGGPRAVKVVDLIEDCESAIGQTYEGRKGGEFRMDRDTKVWVADSGESHQWGVCGVECDDWHVTLRTKYFGYL